MYFVVLLPFLEVLQVIYPHPRMLKRTISVSSHKYTYWKRCTHIRFISFANFTPFLKKMLIYGTNCVNRKMVSSNWHLWKELIIKLCNTRGASVIFGLTATRRNISGKI